MAAMTDVDSVSLDVSETAKENGEAQPGQISSDANADADADVEDEEDDDYDPSSFTFDENSVDAQSTELMHADHHETAAPVHNHPAPQLQPKTIGGFIVEDDDDDEEDEEDTKEENQADVASPPSQLNGTEGSQSGLGAVAVAEATAQDVTIASEAQDTAARFSASTPTVPVSDVAVSTSLPAPATTPSLPSPVVPAADQGKQEDNGSSLGTAAMASTTATPQPPVSLQTNGQVPSTTTSQRLPHDKVGQLEDRIAEDPKGDVEAWRLLISHYRDKNQLDNARDVYRRFFEVFPSAASMWVELAQMELEQNELPKVESIFNQSLLQLPNVQMWNVYLDYLRRIHPLLNDTDGTRRGIISQAFDMLLDNVGIDPDAGRLWRDYVDFIKSGPGIIGGTGWQDAQKADLLRKAYQGAVKVPHSELEKLWREYDSFEMGLNKATGRKYLQEQSPHYTEARVARVQIEKRIQGLDRRSLPRLPPLYGCAGEEEFGTQVEMWKSWLELEKEDPLKFKDDDMAALRKRILYVYKQATMQLRFYPEMWFEAAVWCYDQGTDEMSTKGEEFLDKGMEACPESVLLALKKVDRVESTLETGNSDEVAIRNGDKLDVVFEHVHKSLYALHKKMQERLSKTVASIQEYYASLPPEEETTETAAEDEQDKDDDSTSNKPKRRAEMMKEEIDSHRSSYGQHLEDLKRTISYVWVAKMRAFRRIQSQGQPGKPKKGLRGVFAEARPRGQLTSEVYIASALMEWANYRDASASKIFERGLKLFPTDAVFTLEYIKHLTANNDFTNARAVFETTLTKITNADPLSPQQKRDKSRLLLGHMHRFESDFGDLDKIQRLEKRMRELFPLEPDLVRFSNRFALPSFDAMQQVQLIISPTQALPKTSLQQSQPQQPLPSTDNQRGSPAPMPADTTSSHIRLGPNGPYIASPKRPLEDSDTDSPQQRKFARGGGGGGGGGGNSPLKGAAGRRMLSTAATSGALPTKLPSGPAPLPSHVNYLLSIIPNASYWHAVTFDSAAVVELLRGVEVRNVSRRP